MLESSAPHQGDFSRSSPRLSALRGQCSGTASPPSSRCPCPRCGPPSSTSSRTTSQRFARWSLSPFDAVISDMAPKTSGHPRHGRGAQPRAGGAGAGAGRRRAGSPRARSSPSSSWARLRGLPRRQLRRRHSRGQSRSAGGDPQRQLEVYLVGLRKRAHLRSFRQRGRPDSSPQSTATQPLHSKSLPGRRSVEAVSRTRQLQASTQLCGRPPDNAASRAIQEDPCLHAPRLRPGRSAPLSPSQPAACPRITRRSGTHRSRRRRGWWTSASKSTFAEPTVTAAAPRLQLGPAAALAAARSPGARPGQRRQAGAEGAKVPNPHPWRPPAAARIRRKGDARGRAHGGGLRSPAWPAEAHRPPWLLQFAPACTAEHRMWWWPLPSAS